MKSGVVSVLVVPLLMLVASNAVQAETYYFHNDQLGTPQVVTDDSQQVVWKGEFDPFGRVTETVNVVEQNLRFPGQYYDQETGLHYNYFRTYDPGTGRYVESDPIGLAGGLNTFAYVHGNPLRYKDPTGEFAVLGIPMWMWFTGGAAATAGYGTTKALRNSGGPDAVLRAWNGNSYARDTEWVSPVDDIGPDSYDWGAENVCEVPNGSFDDECELEWEEARVSCRQLIFEQMEQMAGRKPWRSVTGVTGGYTDVEMCAKGLVSLRCGGNRWW